MADLGVAGLLTNSTSPAVWPALVIGGWLLGRPPRQTVSLMAAAPFVYAAWAALYVPSSALAGTNPADPMLALRYLGAHLGALYTGRSGLAVGVGLAGVGLALAAAVELGRQSRARRAAIAPWLMLAVCTGSATRSARPSAAPASGSSRPSPRDTPR